MHREGLITSEKIDRYMGEENIGLSGLFQEGHVKL